MIYSVLKRKLAEYLRIHVVKRMEALTAEVVYQRIFDRQCRDAGIQNDFYPVGAAANHGLLYLLFRILKEQPVRSIVELGSGQSTILIDRARPKGARHVCYEEDSYWHQVTSAKLSSCDYRRRDLVAKTIDGIDCRMYENCEPTDFDLLLVDGPRGEDLYSRFGCVELIRANALSDFVIIFDDADRPGEKQTIQHVVQMLSERGLEPKTNWLIGRSTQQIVAVGAYRSVLHYY